MFWFELSKTKFGPKLLNSCYSRIKNNCGGGIKYTVSFFKPRFRAVILI